MRFEQAATPPSMTENLIFWNAPLPYANSTTASAEVALPITAFGVSRNNGQYVAAVGNDPRVFVWPASAFTREQWTPPGPVVLGASALSQAASRA